MFLSRGFLGAKGKLCSSVCVHWAADKHCNFWFKTRHGGHLIFEFFTDVQCLPYIQNVIPSELIQLAIYTYIHFLAWLRYTAHVANNLLR